MNMNHVYFRNNLSSFTNKVYNVTKYFCYCLLYSKIVLLHMFFCVIQKGFCIFGLFMLNVIF